MTGEVLGTFENSPIPRHSVPYILDTLVVRGEVVPDSVVGVDSYQTEKIFTNGLTASDVQQLVEASQPLKWPSRNQQ